ncbi:hypothetical protein DICPUDRAFT_29612 [Dictyostelium purpureum]|uniref:CCT-eta n=1 Tax=Dictyostelium purpureum TaxID=5786 RepID=F0ZDV1_DICPU|nr:uncharacterized protein DICPUDRAFT_29612 [Dictyostelium purpureum]EGC37843.1 hypothetical protein DICPUDRAFT_29612 [Dictyostelium purpureum]|eukprot:XP_003285593.1 hypothetical protein DICPUDRAFT_29612 [Dictyostelium purpureum]
MNSLEKEEINCLFKNEINNGIKDDNSKIVLLNGEQALQSSINASLSIFSILKTSLGPRSMSKLILKPNGQYIISNDGATILNNIKVQHPAASVLVNIALSQDREVGDGTTSVVLLAGEILKSITELYIRSKEEKNPIHQTTITTILYQILNEVLKILDSVSIEYPSSSTKEILFKMAGVALGTKHYSYWTKNLTNITIDAIQNSIDTTLDNSNNNSNCSNNNNNSNNIDIKNNIQICKLQGGNINQSSFYKGLVMTSKVTPVFRNLDISNNNISIKTIVIGYDINKHLKNIQSKYTTIKSTAEMEDYYKIDSNFIVSFIDRLVKNQVNLVFFKFKIPDYLSQLLYSNHISVVQDFYNNSGISYNNDSFVYKLSKLTNSIPIMKYDELDFHLLQQQQQQNQSQKDKEKDDDVGGASDYGCIGTITKLSILSKFEDEFYIYLDNNNFKHKLSCIIIKGPTKDILDDLEIGIVDSLHLVKSSLESKPMIVYGGGACEMSISSKLLAYSNSINPNESTLHYWKKEISKTISESFQIIPSILVMNSYNTSNTKQPLEIIAQLLSSHHSFYNGNDGVCSLGIDGWTGEIKDMREMNIIEPLILKKSIIITSIEACITLLRIDTIVTSSTNLV